MSIVYINQFQSASALWTPALTTTPLWLDAADASSTIEHGGAVQQWNDKSGNRRNATQGISGSRPLVISNGQNGLNVLRFDGSDDWLNTPYAMPIHNIGVFVAWKLNSGTTLSNKTIIGMRPVEDGRFYISSESHWKGGASINVTDNTDWRVSYLSGSSTQILASINGGAVATASDTNTATAHNVIIGAGGFTVGSLSPAGPAPYTNCDLGEIVMVTGTPSTDIHQRIDGYLHHKWGLTANLPADHRYKTAAPVA